MFSRKKSKKSSLRHSFKERLAESIKSEIMDEDHHTEYVDHSLDGIPLLPNGQTNSSISNELLYKLPLHLQRFSYWSIIDLEKYFKPEEEPETRIETISKTPVNVLMLSNEKKLQLKATALGLARKEEYSKNVGLIDDEEGGEVNG